MIDTSPTQQEMFQAAVLLDDLASAKQIPQLPAALRGQPDPRLAELAIALRRFSGGELLRGRPELFQLSPAAPPKRPQQRPPAAPTAVQKPKLPPLPPGLLKRPKAKANKNPSFAHPPNKLLRRYPFDQLVMEHLTRPKAKNHNQIPARPRIPASKRPGMGNPWGQLLYTDDPVQRNMRTMWFDLFIENFKRPMHLKLTDDELAQTVTDLYPTQRPRTRNDVNRLRKLYNKTNPKAKEYYSVQYVRRPTSICVITPRGSVVAFYDFTKKQQRELDELLKPLKGES